MWMGICLSVCLCTTRVPGTQARKGFLQELEFQMVLCHYVGAGN